MQQVCSASFPCAALMFDSQHKTAQPCDFAALLDIVSLGVRFPTTDDLANIHTPNPTASLELSISGV